jgi:hypothetical protein
MASDWDDLRASVACAPARFHRDQAQLASAGQYHRCRPRTIRRVKPAFLVTPNRHPPVTTAFPLHTQFIAQHSAFAGIRPFRLPVSLPESLPSQGRHRVASDGTRWSSWSVGPVAPVRRKPQRGRPLWHVMAPHDTRCAKSGRRDSNAQHSAWKADALPLSYARDCKSFIANDLVIPVRLLLPYYLPFLRIGRWAAYRSESIPCRSFIGKMGNA